MTFFEKLCAEFPALTMRHHEPLAKHTSFRIGGPATVIFPKNCDEFVAVYRFCLQCGERPLLLGAGTNVLAPDAGVERPVICTKEMTAMTVTEECLIEAECGVLLSRLACFARDRSLTGLEFAHGIPGTVGGGVYMNAGAYNGEMSHVVVRTTALFSDGSVREIEGEDHDFSYRHSIFERQNAVVLKAQFRLQAGVKDEITERMRALAQKRRSSQPLELPSAGSTFKRPAGNFAGALIEQAGLKGKGVGDAVVSEKHAGFVVNLGSATAADVLAAMEYIQKTVYENSGVTLEPEVCIW